MSRDSPPPTRRDHLRSWDDIKNIAAAKGIRFQILHEKEPADPDILYVCKPELLYPPNTKDAQDTRDTCILWNGGTVRIVMAEWSKAALRRYLSNENESANQCSQCKIKTHNLKKCQCPRCESTTCVVCVFKLLLGSPAFADALACWQSRADDCRCISAVPLKCTDCSLKYSTDPLKLYVRVLDKMEAFNKAQRKQLLRIASLDNQQTAKLNDWTESIRKFDLDMAFRFCSGKTVTLRALKRKEWNGRTAKIVGNRTIKNGVIRWPIKLKGEKQPVMIKQCNLQKRQSVSY